MSKFQLSTYPWSAVAKRFNQYSLLQLQAFTDVISSLSPWHRQLKRAPHDNRQSASGTIECTALPRQLFLRILRINLDSFLH